MSEWSGAAIPWRSTLRFPFLRLRGKAGWGQRGKIKNDHQNLGSSVRIPEPQAIAVSGG